MIPSVHNLRKRAVVHSTCRGLWWLALSLPMLIPPAIAADSSPPPALTLIPRIERPLTLEEILDGVDQRRAAVVTGFVQHEPREGSPVSQRTTAYLAYDSESIYVGFLCEDDEPAGIRANVTRRDGIGGDDTVGALIDTYYDHRRAYSFTTNAHGIQEDALIDDTQFGRPDDSFDTLWYSEGQLIPNGYAALMVIPFRSLRFSPDEQQTWGIILTRSIPRNDETSTWPAVSRSIDGWLIQEAEVRGLEDISPGKNLQVNPYGFFSSSRFLDKDTAQFERDAFEGRVGLDAKWVVASNLTLDATVNPDFSQVESDTPQITVNRRFEVLFPEKRPFFMENANYFDTPIQVVFTRRIADPQFGVKLTGKTGPYTIAGLVADDRAPGKIVTPDDPSFGHRAFFNVIRLSRDIHRESGVGMIWSDREFLNSYNRVFGLDGRWKISQTTSLGFQALKSYGQDLDGISTEGRAFQLGLSHFTRHWSSFVSYNERSPDLEVDSGFLQRVDYRSVNGFLGYAFRPEGRWIVAWQPSLRANILYDFNNNVRQDYFARPGFWIEFAQATRVSGNYRYQRERYEGTDFLQRGYELGMSTRRSRWFSARLSYEWGQQINFSPPEGASPFLGTGNEVSFRLTVRPTSRLAVENLLLENRFLTINESRNIFNNNIFRSRWTYQFTPRLSLRLIGQYSNVLPSEEYSSLDYRKTLTGDVLFTYLLHPGTALYVGYSNMLENFNRQTIEQAALLERTRAGLLSTAAGAFVKFSYLYQF